MFKIHDGEKANIIWCECAVVLTHDYVIWITFILILIIFAFYFLGSISCFLAMLPKNEKSFVVGQANTMAISNIFGQCLSLQ